MWNLAKTYAIVIGCVLVTAMVSAASGSAAFPASLNRTIGGWPGVPPDLSESFVSMTVQGGAFDLGDPLGPGLYQLRSHSEIHVVANCPFDIKASFAGLRAESSGKAIASAHLSVAVNGTAVPVGGRSVTVERSNGPTGPSGEDIAMDLKVGFLNLPTYPAGRYQGAVKLTIMPRP
jgi:hypothetical protein